MKIDDVINGFSSLIGTLARVSIKIHYFCFDFHKGSVYTGPDPFGTGTKLVRISLVFTLDLVDSVRKGSAIWYLQNWY